MKTLKQYVGGFRRNVIVGGAALASTVGVTMAAGENAGADAVMTQVSGLVPVAAAVVGGAVLVKVVPWGARLAISAFHAIVGR